MKATVAVLKTTLATVLENYRRLLHLAEYEGCIRKESETILKLNLSWTKYFPACSSQPWQVEGVVRTLLEDGFARNALFRWRTKPSPLVAWTPFASNVYHDWLWYPVIGQRRIREFQRTEWGDLWDTYGRPQPPLQPAPQVVTEQAR